MIDQNLRAASICATILSATTLLTCIIAVPMIYNEVQSIWVELDRGMGEFRVDSPLNQGQLNFKIQGIADTTWEHMIVAERNGGNKVKRQASGAQCNCQADNKCPAGPPGPQVGTLMDPLP